MKMARLGRQIQRTNTGRQAAKTRQWVSRSQTDTNWMKSIRHFGSRGTDNQEVVGQSIIKTRKLTDVDD